MWCPAVRGGSLVELCWVFTFHPMSWLTVLGAGRKLWQNPKDAHVLIPGMGEYVTLHREFEDVINYPKMGIYPGVSKQDQCNQPCLCKWKGEDG